ncbi:TolC family protein [Chitinophaga japonensis]|uniref:Outer membrane protein TolC n=1 Tax=Chitinophaga japonensis TaxID=104662 RepID=A0A562SSU7_CHIJA|nr:TolC family protein [Chitinophaga japonensis]TWI84178.1 outer membrane protein TolC [Chitinophaga japonensis]
MKYFIWILLLATARVQAQDSTLLTLEQCQQLARDHYPLLRQKQVLDSILQLQVRNTNSAYLPQAALNGQATYQSDVTQFPFKVPGVDIPEFAKDQYRATLDVNQLLYDGGATRRQRELQAARQLTEQQRVEVELYKVRQQVTQTYFNALLAEAYVQAARVTQADIRQRIDRLKAGVENGTVLPSNVDMLQAEQLRAEQQELSAAASRRANLAVLQLLTGYSGAAIKLELPQEPAPARQTDTLLRPELALYQLQSAALNSEIRLAATKPMPRISAFVQGGYGRPGLNMLNNDFDAFYMGGIRLNWTLWNWRYHRKEQDILRLQQKNIAHQSETFTLNTNVQLAQQRTEIERLRETLEKDNGIVALRTRVQAASAAQLDNGVITVHDYITDLNAVTQARIDQSTHQIQLALARINYQLIKGY